MRLILLSIVVLLSSVSYAADSNNMMEKEITHLLNHLTNSDCEFNRNDKWYGADEAVKHINRKYNYLIKRGLVNSTEQFIKRAASQSSMSGKPYMVRCGSSEAIRTSVWFKRELMDFREKSSRTR